MRPYRYPVVYDVRPWTALVHGLKKTRWLLEESRNHLLPIPDP